MLRKLAAGWLLGVLTPMLLGLCMAWLGLLPSRANAPQPTWAKAVAQMALHNYVERHAPRITNPIAATDENLLSGLTVFREQCSGCHGDAKAPSDYGASFYPAAPQFASHPPRLPDYQLFWTIKYGVRYSGMAAQDRQLDSDPVKSDELIWKATLFLSRLDTLPPSVDAAWRGK
jgi:mono/diheme cytochrome c family protein